MQTVFFTWLVMTELIFLRLDTTIAIAELKSDRITLLIIYQIEVKSKTNPGSTSSPEIVVGAFNTTTSCPGL
jgi:hypothetical protein